MTINEKRDWVWRLWKKGLNSTRIAAKTGFPRKFIYENRPLSMKGKIVK